MEKLKQESVNLTEQNIDKIAALFPSAMTETKDADGNLKKAINFGTLKQLLSEDVVEGEECYEFTWVGKKQSIIDGNRPIRKTLRPAPEESKNWDKTENLYIEGDNLEVLKLLQGSYLNAVKMIYIDPPYNTGKDFVYRDNFTTKKDDYEADLGLYDEDENRLFQNNESNGRYHSDWCSMMYPRLQLARNLLTDDGVIFISIDDNELENLKKICNEVFGEINFVGQWNWFKSSTPPNLSHKIKKNIEYILGYEKCRSKIIYEGVQKISKSDDPMTKPQNTLKKLVFPKHSLNIKIEDSIIESGIYGTDKFPNKLLNDLIVKNNTNENEVTFENRFIWVQEKLTEELAKRTSMNCSKSLVLSYKKQDYSPEVPPNLIDLNVGVGTTEEAGKQLASLMGNDVFDYPKPISLINYLLRFKDNEIVLDFFSGSATTAHAVMQLNANDGGTRKFIMVQLPEQTDEKSEAFKAGFKNICEIGKERIRRAGDKIKQNSGAFGENLDTGFRVLKLDSTNMKDVYYGAGEYSQQMLLDLESNIKDDRSDLDLLYGVLLDWGVPLSLPHVTETIEGVKVHFVNGVDLVACFADKVTEAVIREIAKRKPLRVVFRDSSFANSPDKINVTEIFKTLSGETTVKVI